MFSDKKEAHIQNVKSMKIKICHLYVPMYKSVQKIPIDNNQICSVPTDQAVRLWLLCPSVQRGAQEEVSGGHALLDGTRGHLTVTLRHGGKDTH